MSVDRKTLYLYTVSKDTVYRYNVLRLVSTKLFS